MYKTLLLFSLAISCSSAYGQSKQRYSELTTEAWDLYEKGSYKKSGLKYSEAFAANGDKGNINDRYNAACSYALAGLPDSSFHHLFRISKPGFYTNLDHISNDSDLVSLHSDPRWSEVIALVKANKDKAEINLDRPLAAKLDSIFEEDQKYRLQLSEVEKKHGWKSPEMQALWKTINEKDSMNQLFVTKLLDERGWLGADIVGGKGNQTLFLVIQHADIDIQEKYLPMMREAAVKGNADKASLALLEDRVALRKGRRQIYGSQIGRDPENGNYYVLPLDDPDNVDKRREEMGLEPLQDYLSNWDLKWDPKAYKKQLPEIEAKQKKL